METDYKGRYLKALKDKAQSIGTCKKGDYFLIEGQGTIIDSEGRRWAFSIDRDECWELIPEGFNHVNNNLTFKTYI